MIVVAIIALLASIAVPGFLRARKRAQATRVINDLRHLDSAVDQYALENNKAGGSTMSFSDLRVYLKDGGTLYNTGNDLFGHQYGPTFTVDYPPKVPPNTWAALSDVAGTDFWSPYL
jgi:type II secretory pathway pseudopilin PulG